MADGPILVTGAAGFIGFHVAKRLLRDGHDVVGLDNMNAYYDPALKEARRAELAKSNRFRFIKLDLAERDGMAALFKEHRFPYVVHLAAQAGVRHSLVDPFAYMDANLTGFTTILGLPPQWLPAFVVCIVVVGLWVQHKDAVLDLRERRPSFEFYGASKKANELMSHAYAHLFGLPVTGLRFFTVYGPWGRPDMAMWIFARSIIAGEAIKLFNNGDMSRDFTYIDDVVEPIIRLIDRPAVGNSKFSTASPDPGSSNAPWRVYNIGNNKPVVLLEVVRLLEEAIGKKAKRELLPMQPGDVPATYADIDDLTRDVGFRPATPIADGISRFIEWYRSYHRL